MKQLRLSAVERTQKYRKTGKKCRSGEEQALGNKWGLKRKTVISMDLIGNDSDKDNDWDIGEELLKRKKGRKKEMLLRDKLHILHDKQEAKKQEVYASSVA